MSKWHRPRKPTSKGNGLVVLHSDDGRIWDYTHFLPTIRRAIHNNDQFRPRKNAIFSPAVNAGYIDDRNGYERQHEFKVMDWEQLREIQRDGGEILSHTKYHIFLDWTKVTRPLNVGDDTIYHTQRTQHFMEGLTFFIEEGSKKETFTVTEVSERDLSESWLKVTPSLTSSYTTNARINITEETAIKVFDEYVDLMAQNGITVKHHINPWYLHSDVTLPWLQRAFESAVTLQNVYVDPNDFDLYNLSRTRDIRHYNFSDIDEILTTTQENNSVAFFQSHGADFQVFQDNFEYIIDRAYELGMRVVTHSEAVDFLKGIS